MLNRLTKIKYFVSILIFSVSLTPIVSVATPKLSSNSNSLENITRVRNPNWQFSRETESISLQNEIAELNQDNFAELEMGLDREIILRERKWDSKRNVENFLIDAEVYQY